MADLHFRNQEGVGVITLARPDTMNVFSPGMMRELGDLYRECDRDDAVRVVVLTGSGAAFSAGADLARGDVFAGEVAEDFSSCPLSMQAWEVRKPVMAACNGHAIGIGLGIAAQCDMRIFASEAKYGFLQNRRGVVADCGIEWLLPRLIGFERAFEMLVRGVRLDGEQALAWRLAGRAVPADQVLAVALEIAADMARNCSPLVMGMHKRLLWRGLDLSRDDLVALETRALVHSMRQPDALEGGMAYVEKRAPRWDGCVSERWPEFL